RSPALAPGRRLIWLRDLLTTGRDQPGRGAGPAFCPPACEQAEPMTVAVSGQARSRYGSAGPCPAARATDLAGCRLCCHQGGSAMAADWHGTARTSLAATEAIRAARPPAAQP